MKYGHITGLFEALKALRTQPQSFSVARQLRDTCAAVQKEADWLNEQMKKLVNTYGRKDDSGELVKSEDGGGYVIDDPEGFQDEMAELLDTETGDIPLLTEADLDGFKVSAEQVDYLLMICADGEEGKANE